MTTLEYLTAVIITITIPINIVLFIVYIGVAIWAIKDSNKWD